MKSITVVVTHEGWFLFCPCWFGFDGNDVLNSDVIPIPKRGTAWLFECAMIVSELINSIIYAITQDDDLCGFSFWAREVEPFEMVLDISDED